MTDTKELAEQIADVLDRMVRSADPHPKHVVEWGMSQITPLLTSFAARIEAPLRESIKSMHALCEDKTRRIQERDDKLAHAQAEALKAASELAQRGGWGSWSALAAAIIALSPAANEGEPVKIT